MATDDGKQEQKSIVLNNTPAARYGLFIKKQ